MIKTPTLCLSLALALTSPAENWPCFRGPSRQGQSTETGLPQTWSTTDKVKWKTSIPGQAWSSPIVWEGRIFLTTAEDGGQSCRVLCLDAATGAIQWNKEVFRQETLRKEDRNTYATPTPVTDGKLVYAVFGSGSVAAVDFQGNTVWSFRDFKFYSRHGLGASPVLEDGLLVMPWDWSTNPAVEGAEKERVGWQLPWDRSWVFALDAATGKLRWKTGRGQSRIGHVTPLVWADGGGRKQVISSAGDVVQGFDLQSGERLWSAANPGEGVSPSGILADGLAIQPNGFQGAESVRAFKIAGAKGDVGQATMAWEQTKNPSKIPSMVYAPPHVLSVTESGLAWCAVAATGEVLWRERLGGTFSASPILAEGRLYATADDGLTSVLTAGPKFEVLSKNPLNEKVQASAAVSGGKIYIRGETHLWCLGN